MEKLEDKKGVLKDPETAPTNVQWEPELSGYDTKCIFFRATVTLKSLGVLLGLNFWFVSSAQDCINETVLKQPPFFSKNIFVQLRQCKKKKKVYLTLCQVFV